MPYRVDPGGVSVLRIVDQGSFGFVFGGWFEPWVSFTKCSELDLEFVVMGFFGD